MSATAPRTEDLLRRQRSHLFQALARSVLKQSQSNYAFNTRSTLFLLGIALWCGAIAAGLMGVWAICFIPIALVKNSPLRFLSIGFFSGLALFTIHAHSMHTIPTALHGSARFNATVQSDPMKVLPQVRGSYRSAPTFAVTATLNQFGEIHTHLPIRIYLDSAQRLTPSEVVEGYGRFTTSHDRTISGSISAPSVTTVRTPNRSNRIAERIRGDFASLSHHFGSDAAALVPGMVLGDTAGESQEFLRAMKQTLHY